MQSSLGVKINVFNSLVEDLNNTDIVDSTFRTNIQNMKYLFRIPRGFLAFIS